MPSQQLESEVWFFHGNLQRGAVWNDLITQLRVGHHANCEAPDWTRGPASDLSEAARVYGAKISASPEKRVILVGYSMGGRLAMHMAVQHPELFSSVILFAAHPGLSNAHDREEALAGDRRWADRIRSEHLQAVLEDWDSLPVFCGIPNPTPRELGDIDTHATADAMVRYSKGMQDDLSHQLMESAIPIVYVSGSLDAKYTAIGERLARGKNVEHVVVPGAGHRVPWEAPVIFLQIIEEVL